MAQFDLKLGQIFYGRSRDGYGILGSSPSGRPFADAVDALCKSIGSPDRPGDVRPFLLSKRERGNVLMVRACRGEDQSERATLFFHVLVAPEDALASAGLDAFVLADRKVFASSLPPGGLEDVQFTDSGTRSSASRSANVDFPAFVAADCPLDAEVRRVLGNETLSRNWSTYSYNPLRGFDFCVYSSNAAAPANGNNYTFDGGRFLAVSNTGSIGSIPDNPPRPMNASHSSALKASLIANVALAALLVAVLVMRGGKEITPPTPSPQPQPVTQPDPPKAEPTPEMTKEEAFSKWGTEWERQWRGRLSASLDKRLDGRSHVSVSDFVNAMKKTDPYYDDYKTGAAQPPSTETMSVYEAVESYVSFVENEILNQQPSN